MVYLGADHRGYELKEKIKSWLSNWGYEFEDIGAREYNKDDDYPDFAATVAMAVALRTSSEPQSSSLSKSENARGILICGSGIGVAIAANKIKGIRAGTAMKAEQVKASVNDEDLNVLAISADYISEYDARDIVKIFLETKFSGAERHVKRIDKIKKLENNV